MGSYWKWNRPVTMTLDEFYSTTSPDLAKEIFGPKAHFHWAVASDTNDPFDQAVIDLFPYIKPNSKVLDCGCGWGGPGRMLQEHLNCDVTGVTISKTQADYTSQFYPTHHTDLHEYINDQHYDLALFFESYFHFKDAKKVLNNLKNVDAILIKDYTFPVNRPLPIWDGVCRSEFTFTQDLKSAGFTIQQFIVSEGNFWQPTIDLWFDKFNGIDISKLSPLMRSVYELCVSVRSSPNPDTLTRSCVIYATKSVDTNSK